MYAYSYISTAAAIIRGYTGEMPLPAYLRRFFSAEKKYGSRDRKAISHLCYSYFRLGNAVKEMPVEARITLALFLCSTESNPLLQQLNPEWNDKAALPLEEKMRIAGVVDLVQDIFPLAGGVSNQLDKDAFFTSHLLQPGLFLRIRNGHEAAVQQLVQQHELPVAFLSTHTLRLPNSIDAAKYFTLNKQVVVQDLSSQQTGELFVKFLDAFDDWNELNILDACAASGGKTIMLYDILKGKGTFTVNDVRSSIMHNLQQRFGEAGIRNYYPVVTDMTKEAIFPAAYFNIIIADVPCSGSGTWGRNPEQMAFFQADKLREYAALQKNIIGRLPGLLCDNGLLYFITCSVYQEENEMNVAFLKAQGLELLQMEYFKGYEQRADTMFGAVFIKRTKQ